MTEGLRGQLVTAASELESLGEHAMASHAYARLGDRPGQARALQQAGAISALSAHLEADRARERGVRSRRDAHEEMSHLIAAGLRRAALGVARSVDDDPSLQQRASALATRRVIGGSVRALLTGQATGLLLGTRLVVGRSDGMAHTQTREVLLRIPSPALSRRHLAVEPEGSRLVVRDLGSRHGTALGPGRGGPLLAPSALVGNGVELRLAGEVRMSLRPRASGVIVSFDALEPIWLVGFGVLPLGIGRWQLERPDDDWIELVTDDSPPAFAGGVQLAPRIPLLTGDVFSPARDGRPYLEIAP